jgi:hypothetical protein
VRSHRANAAPHPYSATLWRRHRIRQCRRRGFVRRHRFARFTPISSQRHRDTANGRHGIIISKRSNVGAPIRECCRSACRASFARSVARSHRPSACDLNVTRSAAPGAAATPIFFG